MSRVAVLAGGPSSEHEVSLLTSRNVLGLLREGGHRARPVLIDHEGAWHIGSDAGDLDSAAHACGLDATRALAAIREAGEIAFVGLHGPYGEDGTVQRLLEDAGVAYTGSGPTASSLCMDKELSKLAASRLGARCAGHLVVSGRNPPLIRIQRTIGYPCFVKPLACGSSVGAGRVDREEDLTGAVAAAQAADPEQRALVEEFTPGSEVTCAVLRLSGTVQTLPLVAIRPAAGFYDYHAKYVSDETGFVCPAPVPEDVARHIAALSEGLYTGLELRGVARIDMILQEGSELPVFLELNTLPGFTSHSLVPMAARAAGLSALHVVEAILADANRPS